MEGSWNKVHGLIPAALRTPWTVDTSENSSCYKNAID